jgi:cytidylate kinase
MQTESPRRPIVAIDGPVASGKSTVARLVAERLGFLYIDTGAMYRAAAWKAMQAGLDWEDRAAVSALIEETQIELRREESGIRVYCDGHDVTVQIRRPEVSRATSAVADNPAVRERLVALQREMGRSGGVVMEGRDIGTVVFPEAEVKVFLDARPEERARRRVEELRAAGLTVSYEETLRDLLERDRRDRARPTGALRVPDGATTIDSSDVRVEEVVKKVEKRVRRLQVNGGSDRIL